MIDWKELFIESPPDIAGRKQAFEDSIKLRKHIEEYITTWKANKRPLTVAGLCAFLGVTRETLNKYESGFYDVKEYETRQFSDTISIAKTYIEGDKLEKGLLGIYNPTVCSFDLTNNHGYKAKQESDINNRYVNKAGEDLVTEDLKIIENYKNKVRGTNDRQD